MTSPPPALHAAGSRVLVDGVSASFVDLQVLDKVSIDIEPGEIVGIIGRSGVGKSTLIRIIGGLLHPDSGSVRIDGLSPDEARAAKRFGYMAQTPALLPWLSVEANVRLTSEVNRSAGHATIEPTHALETVGLAHRARDMPSQLSGGMQHRVALARAIATGAPILLLDEPMSSADERTRHELYSELIAITSAGHQTVIFVTHNLTEATLLSDRVIVLGEQPARIVSEVRIDQPRPRTAALDKGLLRDSVSSLRAALQDGS